MDENFVTLLRLLNCLSVKTVVDWLLTVSAIVYCIFVHYIFIHCMLYIVFSYIVFCTLYFIHYIIIHCISYIVLLYIVFSCIVWTLQTDTKYVNVT